MKSSILRDRPRLFMGGAYALILPACKCWNGRAIEVDSRGCPTPPNGLPKEHSHRRDVAAHVRSVFGCPRPEHCDHPSSLVPERERWRCLQLGAKDSEDRRGTRLVLPAAPYADASDHSVCFPPQTFLFARSAT